MIGVKTVFVTDSFTLDYGSVSDKQMPFSLVLFTRSNVVYHINIKQHAYVLQSLLKLDTHINGFL